MILTLGPGGCGFTFLNWTISYLRGDESYDLLDGSCMPVVHNPLDGPTAHRANKDHLKFKHDKKILSRAHESSIIYITPGSQQDHDFLLGISGKKIIYHGLSRPQELLARSYLTMTLDPSEQDCIILLIDRLDQKYGLPARRVILDCAQWFSAYYRTPMPSPGDCVLLQYDDIFQNLNQHIPLIFNFLGYNIDKQRWKNWDEIYNEYQKRNLDFLSRFLGRSENLVIDPAVKKIILKDVLNWRKLHHHHISSH